MSTYRDLLVWQKCRVLTKEIYTVTGNFPRSEVFGLTAQMRRAVTSIMCNIAEGQGRRSARDQVHFYYMARGSLLELETQLFVSVDLGYIDDGTVQQRLRQSEEIGRMLSGLIVKTRDRDS